jgi:hypothetical protein
VVSVVVVVVVALGDVLLEGMAELDDVPDVLVVSVVVDDELGMVEVLLVAGVAVVPEDCVVVLWLVDVDGSVEVDDEVCA